MFTHNGTLYIDNLAFFSSIPSPNLGHKEEKKIFLDFNLFLNLTPIEKKKNTIVYMWTLSTCIIVLNILPFFENV